MDYLAFILSSYAKKINCAILIACEKFFKIAILNSQHPILVRLPILA